MKILISPSIKDFTVGDSCLLSLSGFKLRFAFQINVSGQQDTLINVVVQCLDRYIQLRMIGEDVIGRLSLHDKRLDDVIHPVDLRSGLVDPFPRGSSKFLILALGKMGVVIVFVRDCTAVFLFRTAVADVGSLVELAALFLLKAFVDLIAPMTGSTLPVTKKKLFADVGEFAAKTVNTEVIRVGKTALVPCVSAAVKPHFLGDGGRIFAKELGDILERKSFIKRFLDVESVFQSKVFLITRY